MTVDEVRKGLQHRNLKKVAEATGIKHNTVWRIASGTAQKPAYEDIVKLIAYLEEY